MKTRLLLLSSCLILLSLFLSACAGLTSLEEETSGATYGPAFSAQEHQQRTFDALWQNLQDSYIYYDTADVDWAGLQNDYSAKIDAGLSPDEFTSLITDLETALPAGSFVYQSRAERLESDLADSATYDGIGAFVGFQNEDVPHIVILAVIEGSPAEQAGLKAHDSIFSIDGNPVLLEEGLSVVCCQDQ